MRIEFGDHVIRSHEPGDIPALVALANNRNVSIQLTDRFPYPYREEDAREWIALVAAQDPETSFAIADGGGLIGGIGVAPQADVARRSAEIGYWVGEPHWGKGIATRAVRVVTDWAFATFDLVRIYARVFETNPASCRVLEKAGYDLEGRLRRSITKAGRTFDQLLYATVRET